MLFILWQVGGPDFLAVIVPRNAGESMDRLHYFLR
jgi:hypothetical protein